MNYVIVGVAGVVGALLRYGLGELSHSWWGYPTYYGTLLINLIGSLCLGWLFSLAAQNPAIPPWVRLGIGTGFIGSFTTFSTFSVETMLLFKQGLWPIAVVYILASMCGGIWLAWLGSRIATRQLNTRRMDEK